MYITLNCFRHSNSLFSFEIIQIDLCQTLNIFQTVSSHLLGLIGKKVKIKEINAESEQ